jgi:hypothetical protein
MLPNGKPASNPITKAALAIAAVRTSRMTKRLLIVVLLSKESKLRGNNVLLSTDFFRVLVHTGVVVAPESGAWLQ